MPTAPGTGAASSGAAASRVSHCTALRPALHRLLLAGGPAAGSRQERGKAPSRGILAADFPSVHLQRGVARSREREWSVLKTGNKGFSHP